MMTSLSSAELLYLKQLNDDFKKVYLRYSTSNVNSLMFDRLINHVIAVENYSVSLLNRFGIYDNGLIEKVRFISLFHDIGRFYVKPFGKFNLLLHGIISKRIMKRYLGDENNVVYREILEGLASHVGVGLKKDELKTRLNSQELQLFANDIKDHIPQTFVQKLVCFSDNMLDGSKIMTFDDALSDFFIKIPWRMDSFLDLMHSVYLELVHFND